MRWRSTARCVVAWRHCNVTLNGKLFDTNMEHASWHNAEHCAYWLDDFITLIINCATFIQRGVDFSRGQENKIYTTRSASLKIIECNEVETRLRIKFSEISLAWYHQNFLKLNLHIKRSLSRYFLPPQPHLFVTFEENTFKKMGEFCDKREGLDECFCGIIASGV